VGRVKKPKTRKKHVSHKSPRTPKRARPGWDQRLDGRTCDGRAVNARLRELVAEYGGPQQVSAQQLILIRRLIWAEGLAIRWENELKDLERRGKKLSQFETGRYLSVVDRVNSVIRQLNATKEQAHGADDLGRTFAAAMSVATSHAAPPPSPCAHKPEPVVTPPAIAPDPAPAPTESAPIPEPTPAATRAEDDSTVVIDFNERRRRET
jgi:hypothetical protein